MAAGKASFFFFLLLLFISSATCRNPKPKIPKTTTLNVVDSLQKTQNAISLTSDQTPLPESELYASPSSSNSSSSSSFSFTLQLHSRDTINKHPTTHKNYRTLTLARLARDSARAKSLNAKLAVALSGIDRSELKPLESDVLLDEADAKAPGGGGGSLQGPIISGIGQGSGEYFSRVGVGRPVKSLYMVLDTGSDVTWVQCQPCSDCYDQTDPVFEPSASTSYSSLSCESQPCKSLDVTACRNDTCLYQVSYGDGSYTVGDFVTETLTFGDSASVSNIALGCGHDNEGLFVGAAGLLGLGGGSLSFPSQISAPAFSYCLVDRDSSSSSTLQFGAGNGEGEVAAPLLRNRKIDTFYYVSLAGLSVGGQMLSIPPSAFTVDESGNGGVIIDSGTAVTRLQSEAYTALRDAFVSATKELPSAAGVALFDTCYDLSGRSSVQVPTVAFHFPEGKSLPLPAKNYLIPVDSSGTFCLGFAPTTASLSIIGNVQQQGTRVGFDLGKSMVGFSPNKC